MRPPRYRTMLSPTCVPRDPADLDLLVDAIRARPEPTDLDVVVGTRGPLSPPEACGLIVPIVAFDQLYSFDRGSLLSGKWAAAIRRRIRTPIAMPASKRPVTRSSVRWTPARVGCGASPMPRRSALGAPDEQNSLGGKPDPVTRRPNPRALDTGARTGNGPFTGSACGEEPMGELDGDGPGADSRRDSLDRSMTYIADRENARDTGLHRHGLAF